MAGALLIVSGPSGSGKSTLMNAILESMDNVYFSISSTTRQMREGEVEGREYYYISKEEFEYGIDNNHFLEWARVHGNYYGTAIKPIKKALKEGKTVMFDIDVQGHKIIRDKLGDIVTSVFITTSNSKILEERLRQRQTDTDESIKIRISNAKEEMKRINEYDFLLVNGDFEKSLVEFTDIVNASQHRVANSDLKKFISSWNSK